MESAVPATGTPFGSGSLAFLFTDIEGSTMRWEHMPKAMEAAVAQHDQVMRRLFVQRGGHVFKTIGDAFCVAFSGPSGALEAAVAAQRALDAEDFSAVRGIRVRMAIHVGEVEARDNDYFGQPVNRLARLLSVAHGGQLLLSGAAAALVRGRLPLDLRLIELGEHRLKDLAHPEMVFQVAGETLRAEFPPLRSLSVLKHNLPLQPTSFVGRDKELADLKSRIGSHRLVTLLGAGGLGKTRLALQAAADLSTGFPDGVWIVELAPLGSPELLAESLASVFGVAIPVGTDAVAALTTFLGQKTALLILDNCEHLLVEAGRVAASIIRAAAGVRIVASSRERLGIAGEFVFQVPPLGLPARGALVTAAGAMNHAGVRLFVERAALALGGFELTDETAPDIVEICRRLDGIALAIELAAPRLKMLKPKELLTRLHDRFRVLTGGDRASLPRQQTLRALIDWSYDLLSEPERLTLRRLSVFADAVSLDDAARVIGDGRLDEWEIFDLMGALLEKSLIVRVDSERSESRYRMLESTWAYARERLKESGEEAEFHRRLVAFTLERFRQADREYQTAATEPWLAKYGPELENLRGALDWCFSPSGDPQVGAELVGVTLFLFEELSLSSERARWVNLAETVLEESTPPSVAGRILFGRATSQWLGQRQDAVMLHRAVDLFREAGDAILLGCALASLGKTYARPGDVDEAEQYYAEAEVLLRPLGRTKGLCNLLIAMGAAREFAGDPALAKVYSEKSIDMARSLGSRQALLVATSNLAEFEFSAGRLAAALALSSEAVATARLANAKVTLALLLTNRTGYLIAADHFTEARAVCWEALELNLALVQDYFAVICLEHLALLHAVAGDIEVAASLSGHGEAYYHSEGRQRESTEQTTWYRLMSILEAALSSDELAKAKQAGAAWTREMAVAFATGATQVH